MKCYLILLTIILIGCNDQNKINFIIEKYEVWDEYKSPSLTNCSGEVKKFANMEKYGCSFKLNREEYDILEKIELNRNGELLRYWKYYPEGPIIMERKKLLSDKKYWNLINGSEQQYEYNEDQNLISLSGNKFFEIEKINQKNKLIFLKRNKEMRKKGKRVILKYK